MLAAPPAVQRAIDGGRAAGRPHDAGVVPCVSSFVCDAPAGGWIGHSHGAGTARPSRREHADDLRACVESWPVGGAESGRSVAREAGHQAPVAVGAGHPSRLTGVCSEGSASTTLHGMLGFARSTRYAALTRFGSPSLAASFCGEGWLLAVGPGRAKHRFGRHRIVETCRARLGAVEWKR